MLLFFLKTKKQNIRKYRKKYLILLIFKFIFLQKKPYIFFILKKHQKKFESKKTTIFTFFLIIQNYKKLNIYKKTKMCFLPFVTKTGLFIFLLFLILGTKCQFFIQKKFYKKSYPPFFFYVVRKINSHLIFLYMFFFKKIKMQNLLTKSLSILLKLFL